MQYYITDVLLNVTSIHTFKIKLTFTYPYKTFQTTSKMSNYCNH